MPKKNVEAKWNKIYADKNTDDQRLENTAAYVLREFAFLLPDSGSALDFACGLGSNAVFLAKHGMSTHAWDISEVAIDKLQTYCQKNNLDISVSIRDVEKIPPDANSFDVICVSFFLDRALSSSIVNALKPNGLLFYQTFLEEKVSNDGPSNPQFRLQQNELLTLFPSLHVLNYQEHGKVGDINKGLRDVATLVAQKRG